MTTYVDDYYRLVRAIAFARDAHGNRADKGGQPFIGHPLRVMAKLAMPGCAAEMLIAAVLHDVVEDEHVSLAAIGHDFGLTVYNLVDALSRRRDEPYRDYIRRCAKNRDAAVIKRADIEDNMDPRRRSDDTESLMARYTNALAILKGA